MNQKSITSLRCLLKQTILYPEEIAPVSADTMRVMIETILNLVDEVEALKAKQPDNKHLT